MSKAELYYSYDSSGNLAGIDHVSGSTKTSYYVATTSRGDVEAIYDTSGNLKARYVYGSWGTVEKIVDASGNSITASGHIGLLNPIRYRGYYQDSETGFYYVSSRYYDPEIRRWISADDSDILFEDQNNILENNLYIYCFNNPASMYDPTGEAALVIAAVKVTVVIASLVYVGYGVWKTVKKKKTYTISKSYWNSHSHSKLYGHIIVSAVFVYKVKKKIGTILNSKGGKQNIRDSGLTGLSDAEVSRRAKDKSLPKNERERYKKEEKARKSRNKQKRKSHY